MAKDPFGSEEQRYYGCTMTAGGRWIVIQYFGSKEMPVLPITYDTMDDAYAVAQILNDRDRERIAAERADLSRTGKLLNPATGLPV
jgi:hypothetical protein